MRRAVLTLIAALPLLGFAQQPIELKYAEFSPDRERIHNTVTKRFAAEVNKAAAGTVKIDLFPNGALGRNPAQQAQMVLDGVADIAFIVPPFTPGRYPDSEVLELPGLFRNLQEATMVYTKLVQSGKIRDFEQFVPIATWTTPPFSIHTTYPIARAADLKGKKIRASGALQGDALRALGAVPVGIPPTDVPESLARRTVDGATASPQVVYDFGYDRVTNTHYFLRLGVVPLVVMMNKAKFESLPKVAQDAIRSHGLQWMADLYAKEIAAYDQELVKRMKDDPKRKVVVPTKPDEQAIQAALEPVVAAWIKKSPRNAELYKAVTAELETIRGGK